MSSDVSEILQAKGDLDQSLWDLVLGPEVLEAVVQVAPLGASVFTDKLKASPNKDAVRVWVNGLDTFRGVNRGLNVRWKPIGQFWLRGVGNLDSLRQGVIHSRMPVFSKKRDVVAGWALDHDEGESHPIVPDGLVNVLLEVGMTVNDPVGCRIVAMST